MSSRLPTSRLRRSASSRDALEQFLTDLGLQPLSLRAQSGGRAGDGGQRSPKIVGNGAQQRAAHLLGLHLDARVFGRMLTAGPLDGQRGLVGENFEKMDCFSSRTRPSCREARP